MEKNGVPKSDRHKRLLRSSLRHSSRYHLCKKLIVHRSVHNQWRCRKHCKLQQRCSATKRKSVVKRKKCKKERVKLSKKPSVGEDGNSRNVSSGANNLQSTTGSQSSTAEDISKNGKVKPQKKKNKKSSLEKCPTSTVDRPSSDSSVVSNVPSSSGSSTSTKDCNFRSAVGIGNKGLDSLLSARTQHPVRRSQRLASLERVRGSSPTSDHEDEGFNNGTLGDCDTSTSQSAMNWSVAHQLTLPEIENTVNLDHAYSKQPLTSDCGLKAMTSGRRNSPPSGRTCVVGGRKTPQKRRRGRDVLQESTARARQDCLPDSDKEEEHVAALLGLRGSSSYGGHLRKGNAGSRRNVPDGCSHYPDSRSSSPASSSSCSSHWSSPTDETNDDQKRERIPAKKLQMGTSAGTQGRNTLMAKARRILGESRHHQQDKCVKRRRIKTGNGIPKSKSESTGYLWDQEKGRFCGDSFKGKKMTWNGEGNSRWRSLSDDDDDDDDKDDEEEDGGCRSKDVKQRKKSSVARHSQLWPRSVKKKGGGGGHFPNHLRPSSCLDERGVGSGNQDSSGNVGRRRGRPPKYQMDFPPPVVSSSSSWQQSNSREHSSGSSWNGNSDRWAQRNSKSNSKWATLSPEQQLGAVKGWTYLMQLAFSPSQVKEFWEEVEKDFFKVQVKYIRYQNQNDWPVDEEYLLVLRNTVVWKQIRWHHALITNQLRHKLRELTWSQCSTPPPGHHYDRQTWTAKQMELVRSIESILGGNGSNNGNSSDGNGGRSKRFQSGNGNSSTGGNRRVTSASLTEILQTIDEVEQPQQRLHHYDCKVLEEILLKLQRPWSPVAIMPLGGEAVSVPLPVNDELCNSLLHEAHLTCLEADVVEECLQMVSPPPSLSSNDPVFGSQYFVWQ